MKQSHLFSWFSVVLFTFVTFLTPLTQLTSRVFAGEQLLSFTVHDLFIPESVEPGKTIMVPIELENTGQTSWETDTVTLGYLLDGEIGSEKTPLGEEVLSLEHAPNNKTNSQLLGIVAPDAPGKYTIEPILLDTQDSTPPTYITADSISQQVFTLQVNNLTPGEPDSVQTASEDDGGSDSDVIDPVASNTETPVSLPEELVPDESYTDAEQSAQILENVVNQVATQENTPTIQPHSYPDDMQNQSEHTLDNENDLPPIDVPEPLLPDTTPPTHETVIIVDSTPVTQVFDSSITLQLTAEDVIHENAVVSGVASYRVAIIPAPESPSITFSPWQLFDGPAQLQNVSIPQTLPQEPGIYTVWTQVQDEAGNISELQSTDITFVAPEPQISLAITNVDGSPLATIENELYPEALEPEISVTATAESVIPISAYRVAVAQTDESIDSVLAHTEWEYFNDQSLITQQFASDITLSSNPDPYTIGVEVRDAADQVKRITKQVIYKEYVISPMIVSPSTELLYGGEGIVSFTIQNTGDDIGYNAEAQLILPEGFRYIEPALYTLEGKRTTQDETGFAPTTIDTNDTSQTLTYASVADLLPGESITIAARIAAGGIADGYALGDVVSIPVQTKLFKRIDFAHGVSTSDAIDVTLVPFISSLSSNTDQEPHNEDSVTNEAVVGDAIENIVTIETNADIASDAPTDENPSPIIVTYELDNGTSYVENTQRVLVNGEEVSPETYQLMFKEAHDTYTNNRVLQWLFGDSIPIDTVIEILFDVSIEKIEEPGLIPDYVDHDELLEQELTVTGAYTQPDDPRTEDVDEESSSMYTNTAQQNIIAKYFTVNKYPNTYNVAPGDTVTYTVVLQTSEHYDISAITLTDTLADGISYVGNIQTMQDAAHDVSLFSTRSGENGMSILTWRLTELDAGEMYTFSYDGIVQDTYTNHARPDGDPRVHSNDTFHSSIVISAIWSDADPDIVRTGEDDTDADTTYNRTDRVAYSYSARVLGTEFWDDILAVMVGDTVQVTAEITFPEDTPTALMQETIYFPIGAAFNEDLLVSGTGTFATETVTTTPISGGVQLSHDSVAPGSHLTYTYSLTILDNPQVREAIVTRNLFRSSYENTATQQFTHRDDIVLIFQEPDMQQRTGIAEGVFVAGESFIAEVQFQNHGSTAAYDVPLSIVLSDTYAQFHSEAITAVQVPAVGDEEPVTFTYNPETRTVLLDPLTLVPAASITVHIPATTRADTLFGDVLTIETTIGEHTHRALEDARPARIYPAQTFYKNLTARESLLKTAITSSAPEIETGILAIDRKSQERITFEVTPAGQAPVYEVTATADIQSLIHAPYNISIDEIQLFVGTTELTPDTYTFTDGLITIDSITLPQSQSISIVVTLSTPLLLPYAVSFPISISALGKNALSEAIRLDGSNETGEDIDHDDVSTMIIRTATQDTEAPTGTVSFIQKGEPVSITNDPEIESIHYASDASDIVAVRFYDAERGWHIDNDLPLLDTALADQFVLDSPWNVWDGQMLARDGFVFTEEGTVGGGMEMIDIAGNRGFGGNDVIYDKTPPQDVVISLSPVSGDFSHPETTGVLENFANFYFIDPNHGAEVGGSFRYSLDGQTWNDWESMEVSTYNLPITFTGAEDGDILRVYLQIRDAAGNLFMRGEDTRTCDASLSESIVCDTITFTTAKPHISVVLHDGQPYTNSARVSLDVNSDQSHPYPLDIRFGKDSAAVEEASWEPFLLDTQDIILPEAATSGEKQWCAQGRASNYAVSAIVCDTVILDATAPIGSIVINNDAESTQNNVVQLALTAQDAVLDDGTPGAGAIEMRFSATGQHPLVLTEEERQAEWSEWQPFQTSTSVQLPQSSGESVWYVQFKDGVGNQSDIFSDTIIINPLRAQGNIIINNDDLYTNTRHVLLTFPTTAGRQPALMRLITMEENLQPPSPPQVTHPDQNQQGWTYWQEFSETLPWQIAVADDPDNPYDQAYGQKTVYVQFMYEDGSTSSVSSDSIIYAPVYGVRYLTEGSEVQIHDPVKNIYGIQSIPATFFTQDTFTVPLNVQNIGSLLWQNGGNHPVHLSYRWELVDGGESFPQEAPQIIRGNSAVLPSAISWNESSGILDLSVDTPQFPGKYTLVIDMIHEGVTWFSSFGNVPQIFNVDITQHPDKEPVTFEPVASGGHDESLGIGGTCVVGSQRTFDGVLQYAPPNEFGARYGIVWNGAWIYIQAQVEHLLGQEVSVLVVYTEASRCLFTIVSVTPKSIEETWMSEFFEIDNPSLYGKTFYLHRGDSIVIQPRFRNMGTGVWRKGQVFLGPVYEGQSTGHFYKDSFLNTQVPNTVANGAINWYNATLTVPDDRPYMRDQVCFNQWRHGGFSVNRMFCVIIETIPEEVDEEISICEETLPLIYKLPNKFSGVVGQVSYQQKVLITERLSAFETEFAKVLVTQGQDIITGWVEDPDNCFEFVTTVTRPLPPYELPTIPEATGDTGYAIVPDGLEVYLGPSDMFPVIDTLPIETEVRVIGKSDQQDGRGMWYKIEYEIDGNTKEGWIPSGLVYHINDPVTLEVNIRPPFVRAHACHDAHVHSLPAGSAPLVEGLHPLSKHVNVQVIAQWTHGGLLWYQFQQGGRQGWVVATDLCEGYYVPPQDFTGEINALVYYRDDYYIPPILDPSVYTIIPAGRFSADRDGSPHQALDYSLTGWSHRGEVCYSNKGELVPVRAVTAGNVLLNRRDQNNGQYIDIQHDNGTASRYLHIVDTTPAIVPGQRVNRGQIIAYVGFNGDTTGCHLHFELMESYNGTRRDPEAFYGLVAEVGEQLMEAAGNMFANVFDEVTAQRIIYNVEGLNFTRCGELFWRRVAGSEYITLGRLADGTSVFLDEDRDATTDPGRGITYMPIFPNVGFTTVRGRIFDLYIDLGSDCGPMGMPVTHSNAHVIHNGRITQFAKIYGDALLYSNVSKEYGRVQYFDKGGIYEGITTGDKSTVYFTIGEIHKYYYENGGAQGRYGFPTSNEMRFGGKVCQSFEGGDICLQADGSIVEPNCHIDNGFVVDDVVSDYYERHGGCFKFGRPISEIDEATQGDSFIAFKQSFEIADIYVYDGDNGYHIEGCQRHKYAEQTLVEAELEKPVYVFQTLGLPESNYGLIPEINSPGVDNLRNQKGQQFQGGFILDAEGACHVILNDTGSGWLTDQVKGNASFIEIAGAFAKGIFEGISGSIVPTNFTELLELGFKIASLLTTGGLSAIFAIFEVAIGIVTLIGELLANYEELLAVFSEGSITEFAYIGGNMIGGIIGEAVFLGSSVGKTVKNGVKRIQTIAQIDEVIKYVGSAMPPRMGAALRAIGGQAGKNDVGRILEILRSNPTAASRIDGDISAIKAPKDIITEGIETAGKIPGGDTLIDTPVITRIYEWVDNSGLRFSVDGYIQSLTRHAVKNLDEYLGILELANQYGLKPDRLIHVLKPDYSNPTSGLHVWGEALEFELKNNQFDIVKYEAPTDLTPGRAIVKDSISGKVVNPKSFFPTSWGKEDIANAGKQLQHNGKLVSGNEYTAQVSIKGYIYEIRGYKGQDGTLISWFPAAVNLQN